MKQKLDIKDLFNIKNVCEYWHLDLYGHCKDDHLIDIFRTVLSDLKMRIIRKMTTVTDGKLCTFKLKPVELKCIIYFRNRLQMMPSTENDKSVIKLLELNK